MTSFAPHLTRRDVSDYLERLYKARPDRRKLVAFLGTGERDYVETEHAGRFDIVPVASELELREALLDYANAESRAAFLVPWSTELPLDLCGQFVQNGRVFRIGVVTRLASLFGATEVDSAAVASPLAQYLLRPDNPRTRYGTGIGRVTVEHLWRAWLGEDLHVDVEGGIALDTFVAWAALDARGSQVRGELQTPSAAGVRDALLAFLKDRLGAAGPIVWQLWEQGRGRSALEIAVLFEPLVASEHAGVRMWIRLVAKTELGCRTDEEALQTGKALGDIAALALRAVERQAGTNEVTSIVLSADARQLETEVREALRASTRLPSSFHQRLDALGIALERAAADPTSESLRAAREARHAVEGHLLFNEPSHTAASTRAEMAIRLLSWLVARPDRALHIAPQPHAAAEALAQWYCEEGGYVDLARRRARGSADSAFGKGVQSVVAAADVARQEIDERFAKALVHWVEAGRPASQVVPIDQALKRIAARFLQQSESRRLLVLLMDGMAWAQAVEILESLGSRAPAWGPMRWHLSKDGRITDNQRYPVVLAGLPTLTETSRAAFFAGKPLGPGDIRDTTKDPERFASHRELKAFFEGAAVPRLLLRSAGHTSFGVASEEALTLVRDTQQRVVAIVVNAIDDSLKSSTQDSERWTADRIRSLVDLLACARESGRSVLFASDHGHVRGDRLQNVGNRNGGGARWRPWLGASDVLAPYEVAVSGSTVHAPRGSEGVVLLANDATCYGPSIHAGEHGGATLAEVVAPCLLLGFEDPVQRTADGDRALEPMAAYVPEWWHYEVGGAPAREEPAKTPNGRRKKSKPPEEQLVLLPEEQPAPAVSASAAAAGPKAPDMDSAFARCEMLAARAPKLSDRKLVVQAVEYLLARGGVAPADAFAAALGYLSFRVRGLVSNLQEVLNVDGYAVISFDALGNLVRLDRHKLEQQFEVKL